MLLRDGTGRSKIPNIVIVGAHIVAPTARGMILSAFFHLLWGLVHLIFRQG